MALSTAESEYISTTKSAAHALEVRSAVVEYGLTFNVVCHLDARLLRLQQLCAEGVVQVRARPEGLNEADLGTKMVDLRRMTSLVKGTPLRPPMGWSSWMVAATLPAVAEAAKDCRVLIWNARNMCETSGWFWICVGMVIVILMVLSGRPFANPIGQMTEIGRGPVTVGEFSLLLPSYSFFSHPQSCLKIRICEGKSDVSGEEEGRGETPEEERGETN